MKKKRNIRFNNYLLSILVICALWAFGFEVKGWAVGAAQSGEDRLTQDDTIRTRQDITRYLEAGRQIQTRGPKPTIQPIDPLRLCVPFDFNSADLTPAAKKQLDELGSALGSAELSGIAIDLAGHTDERGSAEYNLDLSRRRAESAKSYLLKNFEIDAHRIFAVGYGESKPVIPGARTEAEHAVNRRVEISPREDTEEGTSEPPAQAPNPPAPKSLSLQWGVLRVLANDRYELVRYDGTSTLKSNEAYRIYVHPKSPCYVYIYQVDSKGKGSWLFPRKDVAESNPLTAIDNWIPSRNGTFTLDETVGTETIYLMAAHQPAEDLDGYFGSAADVPSDIVSQSITTRGLGEIRVGPPPSEGEEKSLDIPDTPPSHPGDLQVGSAPHESESVSSPGMAEISSQHGDFYAVLKFRHE
jgi:outer membrane protein OmpA-like peptidoglycan-associated protein